MMISTLAEIGHDTKLSAIYETVPRNDRVTGIYSKSKSHKQVEKISWALDMVAFMKSTLKAHADESHLNHQALKDVRGGLDFLRRILLEVTDSFEK